MPTKKKIHVCSVVKNRANNLKRLIGSMNEMTDHENLRFMVADYDSDDGDLRAILKEAAFPAGQVLLKGGFFNRSQGLNRAAQYSQCGDDDLVFFVDVDMLVPKTLPDMIREKVSPGVCWFPICYSLHKGKPVAIKNNTKKPRHGNGWWRTTGKGMCGFTHADFVKIGRWREGVGMTYGGEDGNMARAAAAQLRIVRDRCEGLFHVWHPAGGYKTRHHQGKRAGARPVQPTATVWTNEAG